MGNMACLALDGIGPCKHNPDKWRPSDATIRSPWPFSAAETATAAGTFAEGVLRTAARGPVASRVDRCRLTKLLSPSSSASQFLGSGPLCASTGRQSTRQFIREMLMEATYYYVHLVRFLPAAQALYLLLVDERGPSPLSCTLCASLLGRHERLGRAERLLAPPARAGSTLRAARHPGMSRACRCLSAAAPVSSS